ncbi:MAG: hypothetical protein ACXWCQ_30825 [Burkholderiales bacterium]
MNVRQTQIAAQSSGYSARRSVNKAVRTAKTAAQVGLVAVTGFIAGFVGNPPQVGAKSGARR